MYRKKNGEKMRLHRYHSSKIKMCFRVIHSIRVYKLWVYSVKERSTVWLGSARRWRYHVSYTPNNRG